MVRPEVGEGARPATTWTMRTVRELEVRGQVQQAPANESTRGGPRPPGGSEDTGLDITQVGCRGEQGELPPQRLLTGRTRMLVMVVLVLHPLCLPYPLVTIFWALLRLECCRVAHGKVNADRLGE